MKPGNLYSGIPSFLPEELLQPLASGAAVRIERIVSRGHMSAEGFWYDQPENEWVLLVQGAARLQLENREPIDLRPGDYVLIPAHQKHRVDWTDPNQETIWLAVHFA